MRICEFLISQLPFLRLPFESIGLVSNPSIASLDVNLPYASIYSITSVPVVTSTSSSASTTATTTTTTSPGIGPTASLNVINKQISPDGFSRSAVLAEGTFPGPLITGYKGDTFSLDVTDALTDSSMDRATSIHWHGLFQQGTPRWMAWHSSPSGPLIPSESFTYQFSTGSQAGTFWYHSHFSTQYCDGLRGPLVVYDQDDPWRGLYDVDDETTIITLADWYHLSSIAPSQSGIPDSHLINGLGRSNPNVTSPLAVINVEQGKRYRFRLISTACHPNYNFTIDGHQMTIIEVDGVSTERLLVDNIKIFAGQRYSFVLTASQPVQNYWMRIKPNLGPQGYVGGMNSAILRYAGAGDADPTTQQTPSVLTLNEANLQPLVNPGAPGVPGYGNADINLSLTLGLNSQDLFTINGVSFMPPSVPVMTQILSGSQNASDLLPAGSVITLERNMVVEITLKGGSLPGSPHNFDVVRVAGSSTYNYANPVRRDVVSLGQNPNDEVVFRYVTNNLVHGFSTVISTGISKLASRS